jgi:hypothetical protein
MAVVTMSALFSEADLRRAAGEKSYVRGLDYVDAIADLEIGADQVTATVYGTDAYEIVLILDDGSATGNCSCPHGRDGFFCKHLVATALAVLRQGDIPRQRAAAAAKARSLESWLEELSRNDLLTLVREQVSEDRGLRHRLELRAAAAGSDLGAVQARVRELLDARGVSQYGYIEYADTLAYSGQVDEVVIAINGLIDAGHGAQAAAIARQALAAVVEAMEQADDSGGYIGDSTHALAAAHARACAAAPGDPVELAGWLASFVLGGGQVLPDFATDGYRDALGERGTAEYRRLITQAWRGNPSGWHEKYLMQELLRADGDVDALVAMYAADMLPSGYTHLMIAQELDQAGRATAALEWPSVACARRLAGWTPGLRTTWRPGTRALVSSTGFWRYGRTRLTLAARWSGIAPCGTPRAKPGNGRRCGSEPCRSCKAMLPASARTAAPTSAGAMARSGSAR